MNTTPREAASHHEHAVVPVLHGQCMMLGQQCPCCRECVLLVRTREQLLAAAPGLGEGCSRLLQVYEKAAGPEAMLRGHKAENMRLAFVWHFISLHGRQQTCALAVGHVALVVLTWSPGGLHLVVLTALAVGRVDLVVLT
eukprot:1137494-Pelagomonas_calceolata.AAC.5